MTVQFRRLTQRPKKIALRLLAFVGLALGLTWAIWAYSQQLTYAKTFIAVRVLPDARVVVQNDTTNYDQFASVFLRTYQHKKTTRTQTVLFFFPPQLQTAQIQDFIQVVQACGFEWRVQTLTSYEPTL
jgi:hypothetical protein